MLIHNHLRKPPLVQHKSLSTNPCNPSTNYGKVLLNVTISQLLNEKSVEIYHHFIICSPTGTNALTEITCICQTFRQFLLC